MALKAIYQGKKVKVTKLILHKDDYIKYPILKQVRIEWKEKGKPVMSDYANVNEIKFID